METKRENSRKKILIGVIILAVAVAAFLAVYFLAIDKPVAGEKDINIIVIHSDETEKTVEINTDAEFLREALEEEDLIQGTESDYGLFVETVDGETVDNTNQEWWNFVKDGESLMTGVDATPIEDGDTFEIVFTIGW